MKVTSVLVWAALAAILMLPAASRAGDSDGSTPVSAAASPNFIGSTLPGAFKCTSGSACAITLTAPAGVQAGDVLIADLQVNKNLGAIYRAPNVMPAGWVALPFKNQNQRTVTLSTDLNGWFLTDYILAYVVQPDDPGEYEIGFSQINAGGTSLFGFVVAYRGASDELSSYPAYAYPVAYINSYSRANQVKVEKANSTLLSLFDGNPYVFNPSKLCVLYGPVSGKPPLTRETPSNPCTASPVNRELFATDVAVPHAGKFFGPYTSLINNGNGGFGGVNYAFQVVIPSQ